MEIKTETREYFEQGYEKQVNGQYKEAIVDYNKTLELDREFERAYVQRAFCRCKLKDYKNALADYKTAMSLNPNDARTYLNAGSTLYEMDSKTKDTFYLDKAIELDSNDMAEAYYLRGIIHYANTCQYELAIGDFKKAIEQNFVPEVCYLRMADCYRCIDEFDKALLNYYKVLELKSECDYFTAAALGNIGYIKHIHGYFEEGMEYYKKSKETDPDYVAVDDFIEMCRKSLEEKEEE